MDLVVMAKLEEPRPHRLNADFRIVKSRRTLDENLEERVAHARTRGFYQERLHVVRAEHPSPSDLQC
jgi:hypothetical protein